jgi:hypothetical protein
VRKRGGRRGGKGGKTGTEDEGLLKQSAEAILTQYSIVTFRKGFWSKFVDKFFKVDQAKDGVIFFRTVKQIIHAKEEPGKNDRKASVLTLISDIERERN